MMMHEIHNVTTWGLLFLFLSGANLSGAVNKLKYAPNLATAISINTIMALVWWVAFAY